MTQPGYPHPAYPQPPRKRMSRTTGRLIAAGAVIAMCVVFPAVMLVAQMFSKGDDRPAPAGVVAPGVSPSERVPSASRAAYVAALGKIDPGLVANEERAITRAENTCLDILAGLDGDALADRVVLRLSGGNATIDKAQAQQIIPLMRQWICPHWASSTPSS